jgi:hypothetical protein
MKLAHCRGDGPQSHSPQKSWPALNSFSDGAAAIERLKQQGIFSENGGNS